MSIKSNIVFKILWTHFVRVTLMLKQIHIFFFTTPCLLIKDAPSWTQLMNDSDSSLTYINDSILTHILLFGKASLHISANILIPNATMKYIISANRFQESLFLVFRNFIFCYIFISLAFFPYPYVFFLFINFIFLHYLFGYTQVSREYLRQLVIVIFCSRYLFACTILLYNQV